MIEMGMPYKEIEESDILFLIDLIYEPEEKQEVITYAEQVDWL